MKAGIPIDKYETKKNKTKINEKNLKLKKKTLK